jgi:hypothetical protein
VALPPPPKFSALTCGGRGANRRRIIGLGHVFGNDFGLINFDLGTSQNAVKFLNARPLSAPTALSIPAWGNAPGIKRQIFPQGLKARVINQSGL